VLAAAGATTVLVLVPATVTLTRAASFPASVAFSPRAVAPFPAVSRPDYYRRLLANPAVRIGVYLDSGFDPAEEHPTVARAGGPGSRLVLTERKTVPAQARDLVNALAHHLAGASALLLEGEAVREEGRTAARLRHRHPYAARQALRIRMRRLRSIAASPPPRISLGQAATRPHLSRRADRWADAMPGRYPGRPSPVWAGVAGLLAAAAVIAVCAAFVRPPGRRTMT
jgi:hypothetical protein